jgi:heat shock 70kDa protein 1/2/6/8
MTLLVFHLGGGFYNVSLIRITNATSFLVIATVGDNSLGGEHFDEYLMEHFLLEFQDKTSKDVTDPRALRRLRTACEQTKIRLSTNSEATMEIDSFSDGEDFFSGMSLENFHIICADLFTRIEDGLESLLIAANCSSIDDVILVGGSTRIPKVREIVERIVGKKKINFTVDAMDAAVQGVAIAAAAESGTRSSILSGIRVKDVATYKLITKEEEVLVCKNESIPFSCEFKRGSSWFLGAQNIEIFEMISNNKKRCVKDFAFKTRADSKASMSIDRNGVISDFTVTEIRKAAANISCSNQLPQFSEKDIQKMTNRINTLAHRTSHMRIFESAKREMSDSILYWEQVANDKQLASEHKEAHGALSQIISEEHARLDNNDYKDKYDINNHENKFKSSCEEVLKATLEQEIPAWMLHFVSFERKPMK